MIQILYQDNRILVCVKPHGVMSTDEPGGLPALLRQEMGVPNACLRTVHRLDQVVGGVMVLARSREAARQLSAQVAERTFQKRYLAVVEADILPDHCRLTDLLARDKQRRITYTAETPGPETREAVLDYRVLARRDGCTLVSIDLHTGRTHQIRAQMSAHFGPVWGDRKYGSNQDAGHTIGLWSHSISFQHPQTAEHMRFSALPAGQPWDLFSDQLREVES